MAAKTATADRELMHEPFPDTSRPTYLVSGARMDGMPVGPAFAPVLEAHAVARTSIAGIGGTVDVWRYTALGWVAVARYTDTGERRVRAEGVAAGRPWPPDPPASRFTLAGVVQGAVRLVLRRSSTRPGS